MTDEFVIKLIEKILSLDNTHKLQKFNFKFNGNTEHYEMDGVWIKKNDSK